MPRRRVSSRSFTDPPYDQRVSSIARTERLALAALLDAVGPTAPTLCAGWTTHDLAAHLVTRERRPDAAAGIAVRPLSGWTASVQAHLRKRPYDELVDLVRTGPGRLSAFALPGADKLLNTTEYVVHHEDVRRAQPGWSPRPLPPKVQDALWQAVRGRAPLSLRKDRSRVELHRTDAADDPVVRGHGERTVTVSGEPLELLLFLFGRREHARVRVGGDPVARAELDATSFAI
jgi:uncharacterized protein (TIGR03085 family)